MAEIHRPGDPCADCGGGPRVSLSYCSPCWRKREAVSYQDNAHLPCSGCGEAPRHRRTLCTRCHRDRRYRSRYGISIDDFESMLEGQGGGCAICGSSADNVDHCHATGRVRGVLCGNCNRSLGLLGHSPDTLRIAADYLEDN